MGRTWVVILACGLLAACYSSKHRPAKAMDAGSAEVKDAGSEEADASAAAMDEVCSDSDARGGTPFDAGPMPCEENSLERFCDGDAEACDLKRLLGSRDESCSKRSASRENVFDSFILAPNACGGLTLRQDGELTGGALHYNCEGTLIGYETHFFEPGRCGEFSTKRGIDCRPLGPDRPYCEKR